MEWNRGALIGKWMSVDSRMEKSTLAFKADGELEHTLCGEHKDQKIFLTYRVEDDSLIIDQPLCPRGKRTPFKFTEDGKLVLDQAVYVRCRD